MVDESRCDLIIEDVYRVNCVTFSIVALSEPVSSVLSCCETGRSINLNSLLRDFTVNDLVLLAVLGSLGNQDLHALAVKLSCGNSNFLCCEVILFTNGICDQLIHDLRNFLGTCQCCYHVLSILGKCLSVFFYRANNKGCCQIS